MNPPLGVKRKRLQVSPDDGRQVDGRREDVPDVSQEDEKRDDEQDAVQEVPHDDDVPTRDDNPDDEDDEDGEDALPSSVIQTTTQIKSPSKAERYAHYPHHLPYRSWCEHCVKAKGRVSSHRASGDDRLPGCQIVHIDFAFLRRRTDVVSEDDLMPILVMKDDTTRMASWLPLQSKSNDGYSAAKLGEFVKMLGYKKLFIKFDNESSILALKRRVRDENKDDVTLLPEESATHDPQTNGTAEAAVKIMQENVRVHLSQLSHNYGRRIPLDHVRLTWLIPYVATLYNLRYPIKGDGRTLRMNWKLRQFHGVFYDFGRGVFYRRAGEIYDAQFVRGIYLGKSMMQPYAHIIADSESGALFTTRDIKIRTDETSFDWDEFSNAIKQAPWGSTPPKTSMTATYAEVTTKADKVIAPARF
jgi:hypothetical protein